MKRSRHSGLPPDELAVLSVMADWPLELGQALWLGPKSVALLKSGEFVGKLPDKFVMERSEWDANENCRSV